MNPYADPTVCPGCRSTIDTGTPNCSHCGLRLTGDLAQQLFVTLTRADNLVAQLRLPDYGTAARLPASPPPTAPTPAPIDRTPRLSSASIPKILLGLGALCLLVAAVVFLAVAWSALGTGGRTAVLVGLTVASGGASAWLSTKALRAGAEAFSLLGLGLLTLDLFGAESAGWLGNLSTSGFTLLLGLLLAVVGTGAAAWALRSPVERLAGAEIVAALGVALALTGWVSGDTVNFSAGCVGGVLLSATVAFAAWRARLVFLSLGTAVAAGLWWLLLLLDGLVQGLSEPTVSSLVGNLQLWPLIAAAALAGAPAAIDRLPRQIRVLAAGVGLTVMAVAVALPAAGDPLTVGASVALAVLAAASLLAAVAPGSWSWSAVGALVLSGAATAGVLAVLVGQAVDRLAATPWSVSAGAHLSGASPEASPLLVLPGVVALAAATWVFLRLMGATVSPARWTPQALGLVTGGLAVTLALHPAPRWTVLAALLTGAVATWAVSRQRPAALLACSLLAAAALAVALPSDWLSAAALLVVTGLSAAIDFRTRGVIRDTASAVSILLLGSLLWTSGHLALMPEAWLPVLVIGVLGLLTLARPVPAYELAAAAGALVAIVAVESDLTWLAVYLTLAGALVSASALLHRRPGLGWIGSGLLFLATWVRLLDLEVSTVEAYTLPLALALVAFGLHRMHRDDTGTLPALSPGLALAVVPSLLQALGEPASARALLVGLACAVFMIGGAALRWSSPLLIGAGAGLLLVLREATYAQVLPQWVFLGLIGMVLTICGVTWEQRLQELRVAARYVRHLR